MITHNMGLFLLILLLSLSAVVYSDDAAVLKLLRDNIKNTDPLNWSGSDPCKWENIECDPQNRVTKIQLRDTNLKGTLPQELSDLTSLAHFEVPNNQFTGPFPSLSGLTNLNLLYAHNNTFTSFPTDFFVGKTSLVKFRIDDNPFTAWTIPDSVKEATALQYFSAGKANLTGKIPDSLGKLVSLSYIDLSFNYLEGELPGTFSGSIIQTLRLNGQQSSTRLNGSIAVLAQMNQLTVAWLNMNHFTGPIPDLSNLTSLNNVSFRDNQLTGIVPSSFVNLKSLMVVNLTNNLLQGPTPMFGEVQLDLTAGTNRFCSDVPGVACDSRVTGLLSAVESMGYPQVLAENWKGNDPCDGWKGITCVGKNVVVINFQKLGLSGSISPNFSSFTSLQKLILADNSLTGTIPTELTKLPNLQQLDVSNNQLYGKVPSFRSGVVVNTAGNPDIGKDKPSGPTGSPSNPSGDNEGSSGGGSENSKTGVILGAVIGSIALLLLIAAAVFCMVRRRRKLSGRIQKPHTVVIHPGHSGDQDTAKITVAGANLNGGANGGANDALSSRNNAPGDIHVVEAGNMVISIQVLREVTNNFSEKNILGRGGFGTVYKGELHDGTKIAVKRMELGAFGEKGMTEFMSEITVLTKVRHRHLVTLLGYCLDGNEKLLVYEYMPQGTLSMHLFNWMEENGKPLDWTRRLTIALDVARAVEYLHSLAHQSFIHRDLKPSNILLGDDMRAKVADFGLVRLAPEGKFSVETKLAGTFGYLAPEYAVTGRVTTKVDLYSFGVILMELITGRKALDESQPEDSMHLVTWFRRMHLNKETFPKAIDPSIELCEETLASINTVAELAGYCCAREPYQRPDMGHAVNVLSSIVSLWKPAEPDAEDVYGIDLDMTLPQALKKWQSVEGISTIDESSSSFLASKDNTQTSIPTCPSGFAESFTSVDGR